jgi:hypothetical protein
MFMRFRGGGIGHTSTRAETEAFKTDRDELDEQSRKDRKDTLHTEGEKESGDEEMGDDLPSIDIIEGKDEAGEGADEEGELMDYGYEPEVESDEDSDNEDEEDRETEEEEDY